MRQAMSRSCGQGRARLRAIATALPDTILTNADLAAGHAGWTAEKILAKTGISERRIAAPGETAADLAFTAATRLFQRDGIDAASIDFVLLCTQTPDHPLPSTACLLQHRLGLSRGCGALDVNLGCSGYVYALSLAKGLIEAGMARRVLLLTADTYSRIVHPADLGTRALFGDGAAASLVDAEPDEQAMIGPFVFGTDGSGGGRLIVQAGGMRHGSGSDAMRTATGPSPADLFMDGPAVMAFALAEVPRAVAALLERSGMDLQQIDLFVFHQANALLLEALRRKLDIPPEKFVVHMAHCGNTVSSSIPFALEHALRKNPQPGRAMLVGFGVGFSWAATNIVIH